jgi:hypothetical protein
VIAEVSSSRSRQSAEALVESGLTFTMVVRPGSSSLDSACLSSSGVRSLAEHERPREDRDGGESPESECSRGEPPRQGNGVFDRLTGRVVHRCVRVRHKASLPHLARTRKAGPRASIWARESPTVGTTDERHVRADPGARDDDL